MEILEENEKTQFLEGPLLRLYRNWTFRGHSSLSTLQDSSTFHPSRIAILNLVCLSRNAVGEGKNDHVERGRPDRDGFASL